MQNNLESIGLEEVSDNNGISYTAFRQTLKPRYHKVAADILKGYIFLFLISALIILLTDRFPSFWWLFSLIGAVLIGYTIAYLALFIHEAGHFNLHPDKKINDRLATVFLCMPLGVSIKSYRKIHWQHHVHLGSPRDAEVSYFHALTKLFFVETLTGIHVMRAVLRKDGNNVLTPAQKKESHWMLLAGMLYHLLILTVSFLTGNWPFAICWVLGNTIFFPFFFTIRQILEHRDELATASTNYYKHPHGKVSRLFVNTLVSSSFGSAGFTRHMIHHWDPQISYTRLRDIEDFLARSPRTESIIRHSKTSYRKVLKTLLRAS